VPVVESRLPWFATKHREAAETQVLFRLTFAAATLASYHAPDPAAQAKKLEAMVSTVEGWVPGGTRGPQEDRTRDAALYAEQQAHLGAAVAKLRQTVIERG
jgi:hypothetical protein